MSLVISLGFLETMSHRALSVGWLHLDTTSSWCHSFEGPYFIGLINMYLALPSSHRTPDYVIYLGHWFGAKIYDSYFIRPSGSPGPLWFHTTSWHSFRSRIRSKFSILKFNGWWGPVQFIRLALFGSLSSTRLNLTYQTHNRSYPLILSVINGSWDLSSSTNYVHD